MNRRGFSLIELLFALTMSTTVLLLAAKVVHSAIDISTASTQRAAHQENVSRLAQQFRLDVHRAIQCEVVEEKTMTLRLESGEVVRYEAMEGRVEYRMTAGENLVRHDAFPFKATTQCRFVILDQPRRCAMTVAELLPWRGELPRIDRQVEAVLGRSLVEGWSGRASRGDGANVEESQ